MIRQDPTGAPMRAVSWTRLRNRAAGLNTKHLLFALTAIALLWLVGAPIIVLVRTSLTDVAPGTPGFFALAHTTLNNYVHAVTGTVTLDSLANTGKFAVGSAFLGLVLGSYLAWAVERTNMPLRGFITISCIGSLVLPGLLLTIAWAFLASPNIGWVNKWAEVIPGINGPLFNIYSMGGMIWVQAMNVMPLTFMLVAAALRSMDPSLEEASRTAGKGILGTTVRITFPTVLPAVLASILLMFILGVEMFEVPLLLGIRGNIPTFALDVWSSTSKFPPDQGRAAVYAVFVLVLTLILVWGYNRATRHAEMFATISGKGFRPRRSELRPFARWTVFVSALAMAFCVLGLPLLVLIWASLSPGALEPISLHGLLNMTLDRYREVWSNPLSQRAFRNSTVLAVVAATAVVMIVSVIAWIVVKTRIRGRQWLDHLAFAPIAIPSVVMGAAFVWLYLEVPLPIYGTLWILALVYIAKYSAVSMRIMSASVTQVNDELVEAAQVSGVSWVRAFRTVALPLLRPGILAAWLFVAILAFREFTASLFVYSYGNEPVAVVIYDEWSNGTYGLLSAFGVSTLVILVAITLAARAISARFGIQDEAGSLEGRIG